MSDEKPSRYRELRQTFQYISDLCIQPIPAISRCPELSRPVPESCLQKVPSTRSELPTLALQAQYILIWLNADLQADASSGRTLTVQVLHGLRPIVQLILLTLGLPLGYLVGMKVVVLMIAGKRCTSQCAAEVY